MHGIVVTEPGAPDVMKYVELPDPVPGEGQIVVETDAIGVNYIDIYRREGRYPQPEPRVPGEEGSGRVLAVGPDITEFKVGDRVVWTTVLGSYATKVLVPDFRAVLVPDGVDMQTAAAALVHGMTAHYLVNDSYKAKAGDTLLVHAAAGGVGLLLVQMLKALGCKVIGTVSTEEKEKAARAFGADEIIRYDQVEDLAAEVKRLNGGEGVHAVYDGVGAATFDASLASLRMRGTMVLFGGASGAVPPFDPMKLAWGGSLTLTRPYMEHFRATREEFQWRANEVFQGILDGKLKITIDSTYPLANAPEAHAALASRRTMGKLLLLP
ncbi:MAG: zinc-binding dehydrogenase family protein [Cyanobacteria bacterium RYN_339]|nr:zinc-binding dehydrogenase family protein [Cyanobacteria bacterium RYN_339]